MGGRLAENVPSVPVSSRDSGSFLPSLGRLQLPSLLGQRSRRRHPISPYVRAKVAPPVIEPALRAHNPAELLQVEAREFTCELISFFLILQTELHPLVVTKSK